MNFTVENLEFFILIMVRISAFIFTAPIFSMPNTPRKVKAGLSFFLSIIVFQMLPYEPVAYTGVIGFAAQVFKEAAAGLLIGFMANICAYILGFAGSIIDMEIGFSMVNEMNPVANMQTTITSNYYTYFVMLMLLITDMHYYIIYALFDTFKVVPVGKVSPNANLYLVMARFIGDYLVIGFRIALPIFSAMLLVNVVLGILAKVAPQMNMFVIGIQLKIVVGLFILFLIASLLPAVSQFIFQEMRIMMQMVTRALAP